MKHREFNQQHEWCLISRLLDQTIFFILFFHGQLMLIKFPKMQFISCSEPFVWAICVLCVMSYRVSCILCSFVTIDIFLGFSLGGFFPSAMFYLANQWIHYSLPIKLIDSQALSEAIYITSVCMWLLPAHVKSLQT